MSIATPALWNSVHRPIVYTIAPNYIFALVGSNGGNAKLAVSPSPNGANFIVGANAIVTSGIYAGTHKVLAVVGTEVTIDTPFISNSTGGVISTRIPCEFYAGYQVGHVGYDDYPYQKIADITAIRGISGNADVDVSGFLKGVLKEVKAPRIGRDFQMSVPFNLTVAGETVLTRYALNGTLKQTDLANFDGNFKILNAREPIHFVNGKTIYSMIWNETAEFGEHIVNILAVNGDPASVVGGIGYWEIGSTFIVS